MRQWTFPGDQANRREVWTLGDGVLVSFRPPSFTEDLRVLSGVEPTYFDPIPVGLALKATSVFFFSVF